MAKKGKPKETDDAEEPGSVAVNDAWTGMLIISFLALSIGTGFVIWDWSQYGDAPTVPKFSAPPGAKAPDLPKVAPKDEPKDPGKDAPAKEEKKDDKKDEKKDAGNLVPSLNVGTRSACLRNEDKEVAGDGDRVKLHAANDSSRIRENAG